MNEAILQKLSLRRRLFLLEKFSYKNRPESEKYDILVVKIIFVLFA